MTFPFKSLNKIKYAMTAHIKYNKLDNVNCATQSKVIINKIVRKLIGFKGILFSDDLCMKALKGGYSSEQKKLLKQVVI